MPLPRKRQIELSINDGTIKDLIISHLHNIGYIRDYEEVTDIVVGDCVAGLHRLTVKFEPETQVIFHE